MNSHFWKTKSLAQMNHQEWESICDGCGKCCLQQLEGTNEGDEQTTLVFTDIACDLLDQNNCRCTDYDNRSTRVPSCMTMTAKNVYQCAEFAPSSCAYRLLLEGRDLPDHHHLVCGDRERIHKLGKSVKNRVVSSSNVHETELEHHIVDWPEQL